MSHTQEPWFLNEKGFSNKGLWSAPTVYAADAELRYVAVCACADEMNIYSATDNAANARRIVACVNACEGFTTEGLEQCLADGDTVLRRLEQWQMDCMKLEQQRDKVMAALNGILDLDQTLMAKAVYEARLIIDEIEASK